MPQRIHYRPLRSVLNLAFVCIAIWAIALGLAYATAKLVGY